MKNNDDGNLIPLLNFLPPDQKSIRQYKQVIPVTIYHFYIVDELEEVEPYLDLLHILATAEQHDTIYIHLNSGGGRLDVAIQIINAIKSSSAMVITVLTGSACSAASLIFLAGHKYIINPLSTFMIHNYSTISHGKGGELASSVKYNQTFFKKLFKSIYGGFLTEDEIENVVNDKDIWMDSDQVIARLKKSNKLANMKSVYSNESVDNNADVNSDNIEASVPMVKKKQTKKSKKKN